MSMKVISKEKRLCTCCMEEHDVKTVQINEHNVFKNVPVEYMAEYFYCDAADEIYMNEKQIQANDMRMKDAYRKATNILTSEDIRAIRVKYGISQSDLCMLLGWGGKTITRYESHQVQDKAHDTILKKLNQDPDWFICLLKENNGSISKEYYKKYLEIATRLYEENRDNYLRKAIQAMYVRFHDNEMYNGKAQLSLDKVVDVIRYFSNSDFVTNLYKVKLMKLMWYGDFLSYKVRGYAITGLIYQAFPMGAVPIGHDSIINLNGVECEEIDMGDYTAYRFNASNNHEFPNLSEGDKKILDKVVRNLGKKTKNEIISYMHKEQAYIETAPREIIQFKFAESLLIE